MQGLTNSKHILKHYKQNTLYRENNIYHYLITYSSHSLTLLLTYLLYIFTHRFQAIIEANKAITGNKFSQYVHHFTSETLSHKSHTK